jgi:predicted Rossmann fold nucleotide-binding protein DprA/Smf involved in DNA uptake
MRSLRTPPPSILAVVGSTKFQRPEADLLAPQVIATFLAQLQPLRVVSGGAEGVDAMAREIASQFGWYLEDGSFVEHLPKHRRWSPDGFKERNVLIAEECTHLLAIRCHASKTYGSGWTADYAEKRGRTVYRVVL